MKKILLFLLILNQFVFSAVSEDKIDYVFGAAADKYNIDPKVIAAVAYYESRLYPNIVSILTKSRYKKNIVEKYLKKHNYKYKKHKRRVVVYVSKSNYPTKLFNYLNRLKLGYDVGLMQINSFNIKSMKLNPVALLYNVPYNIEIGAKILRKCFDQFSNNIPNAFECYNKGYNTNKYTYKYYTSVIKAYMRIIK